MGSRDSDAFPMDRASTRAVSSNSAAGQQLHTSNTDVPCDTAVPQVLRYKAAIRRSDLSLPLKCVLRDNLLNSCDFLFDYGCGYGDDIRHLQRLGVDCDGWDPAHRPDVPRRSCDAVHLGYVLNVIEDIQERADTLLAAWRLCCKILIIAVRVDVGDGGRSQTDFGDGVITRRQTFQKIYSQTECREYLEGLLQSEAFPAAPGIFYVFKNEELREQYFAAKYRRRGAPPRKRIAELQFEEYRALLEPLIAAVTDLGRLPFPDELGESTDIIATFGSLKRAFALIRSVTGTDEWDALRQGRVNDLTVYLALARFRTRPPLTSLPLSLQRDIREFFGTYKRACDTADELLFMSGDHEAIDQACQRSPVGRLTSNALFVHKTAVAALEPVLRTYEGCARAYLGEIDDANIVKLHRFSGKVSYLACPDFDAHPHPAIRRTVKLSMRSRELDSRDHGGDEDPVVLDRKESLVDRDYPWREKFARFTQQEELHGLLDGTTDLSSRLRWEIKFEQVGLQVRGYRLLWKAGETRRRPRRKRGVAMEPPKAPQPQLQIPSPAPEPASCSQVKEPSCKLPVRSKRFGIGKEIGTTVYVHRQYEDRLGPTITWAKRWLPSDFVYEVVKYNRRMEMVSFIHCPGFDVESEPTIHAIVSIRPDVSLQRRPLPMDPFIYHHKWLFVDDDYDGFDVEASKQRSLSWLALPGVDKSRIGRKSYWEAHVIPRLNS